MILIGYYLHNGITFLYMHLTPSLPLYMKYFIKEKCTTYNAKFNQDSIICVVCVTSYVFACKWVSRCGELFVTLQFWKDGQAAHSNIRNLYLSMVQLLLNYQTVSTYWIIPYFVVNMYWVLVLIFMSRIRSIILDNVKPEKDNLFKPLNGNRGQENSKYLQKPKYSWSIFVEFNSILKN